MKKFARLRKTYGVVVAGILLGVGSIVSTSAVTYANTVPDPAPADEQISVATDRTTDPVDGSGEMAPEPEETEAPTEVFDPEETEMSAEDVDPEGAEAPDDESEVVESNAITSEDGDVVIATFTTAIDCDPAKIFAVTESGSVLSVNETGGTPTKIDDGWYNLYNAWKLRYVNSQHAGQRSGVNGLAIAADGTMYAYARGYDTYTPDPSKPGVGSQNLNLRIRMLVKPPSGNWAWLDGKSSTASDQKTYAVKYLEPWGWPVTGAIDPHTGYYVWGEIRDGSLVIRSIDVNDAGQTSYVNGRVSVGLTGSTNGDIAFDSAGNLYVVAQTGSYMTITTVTAADLAANRVEKNDYNYWPAAIQGSTVKTSYSGQVNGIAVGADGGLYVSTTTKIYPVDPLTGKMGAAIVTNPYTSSISDLSSCAKNGPTTITLQKDLRDEGKSNDEFRLSVSYDGTELVSTTAKTRVSGTSVLEEMTGPTWVSTGAELTLKETGTKLSGYASDLACSIDGGNEVPVDVARDGTSGTLTIPGAAAGKNITCTFTNTPRPDDPTGAITLIKTDPDGAALAGAKFQLWEDVDGNGVLGSPPDVKVGGARTSNVNGVIEWTNLDPAKKYLVEEAEAPAGYKLPAVVVSAARFDLPVPRADQKLPAGMIPIMPQLREYLLVGTSTSAEPTMNINSSDNELGKISTVPWSKISSSIGGWPVTGAANLTARTSYDGNVAFSRGTKAGYMFNMGTIQMYADTGTVSKSTNPFKGTGGYWYPTEGQTRQAIANSKKQDVAGMTALQSELEGLKTYVAGLSTEGTAAWTGSGTTASPKTINVDSYDKNGDGIAVISIDSKSELKGPYVISGSGNVFPVFVLSGSDVFKLNNASLQLSTAMAASFQAQGLGAMFVQTRQTSDPFNFANSLVNGVGFYDLSMAGDGKFQMSNVQGCGQFVGQIMDFNNVSLSRCSQSPAGVFTVINEKAPETARLTLIKEVDNSYAGTAGVNDFNLTATADGQPAIRFNSSETKEVDPGDYTIGETLLDSYEFVDISCESGTIQKETEPLGDDDKTITAGKIKVEAGDDVVCTLRNKDVPPEPIALGTIAWEKVDEDGAHLAGSEWTLVGPIGPDSVDRTVTDCVAANTLGCLSGGYHDMDYRAGYFAVWNIGSGQYTLTETKAPAGYKLGPALPSFDVDVTGSNPSYNVGEIVNEQADGPNLPLTGGMSSAMFAFLGGGLFGAALLGAKALRKKGAGVHAQ